MNRAAATIYASQNIFDEALASLYLRLNGYFTTGFIAHKPDGNRTEVDIIAVRFPKHCETEVGVGCCNRLPITNGIDVIIGEVKNRDELKKVCFNNVFYTKEALKSILKYMGLFDGNEIEALVVSIANDKGNQNNVFPEYKSKLNGSDVDVSLKLVLFAIKQKSTESENRSFIFYDDIMRHLKNRLVHPQPRAECASRYNFDLWGPLYEPTIRYFKEHQEALPDDAVKFLNAIQKLSS
jgi:hypothetical protein